MTRHGKKRKNLMENNAKTKAAQTRGEQGIGLAETGPSSSKPKSSLNTLLAAIAIIAVVVLGYGVMTQAISSSNTPQVAASVNPQENTAKGEGGYQEIHMNVTAYGWQPDRFVLKAGVPVKWVIDGQQLTGCNNAIKVPSLGLSFNIKKGQQTIEFTPAQAGTIPWSCWMGMIRGTFIVKDNPETLSAQAQQAELDSLPKPSGGGGCGCGG